MTAVGHRKEIVSRVRRALSRRPRPVLSRLKGKLLSRTPELDFWQERARDLGARAVFSIGHSDADLERVTALQKQELYPRLRGARRGDEKLILDLGCGTGRFTADPAELLGGRAVGIDPIARLIELAPRGATVDYRVMKPGSIPLESSSVDVIWSCLVLGGIRGELLDATIAEVKRVLRPGGLMFLAENTSKGMRSPVYFYLTIADYQRLLAPIRLQHVHDYYDLEERISVMLGRR